MGSQQHQPLRVPAAVLVLSLLAACGGDRSRPAGGADTTGAAAVVPDSAAMPTSDSGAARDTAKAATAEPAAKPAPQPSAGAGGADTGAKKSATAAPAKIRPSREAAAAPTPKPKPDTAGGQPAESTKTAAAPAPKPTAQQQDTSKPTTETAETPLRDAYHQAPKDTVSQAVYSGWKQFNLNCARCHGEDALGTTIAPHLILSLKPDGPINTKELFMQTVCAGRPAKGMPSWCALGLGMDKIDEIYQYVKGRSDAKISPGRPAVKPQG